MANRLADATSPYLLQHQHNPVAWQPWDDQALDEAKASDKPEYAFVDDTVIPFKAGDFFTCPAWHDHSFVNDGDEDMVMIAVHDLPILAQARALFWQEPIGDENTQPLVREKAGSWSAEETWADTEAADRVVKTVS